MSLVNQNTAIIDTEIAQVIRPANDLKKRTLAQRFYVGDELCEYRLPDLNSFRRTQQQIRKMKKNLSLLTPFVSEHGLHHVRALVTLLHPKDEVIVNDFGVLSMLKTEFNNPIVIGRVLSRNVLLSLLQEEVCNDFLLMLGNPKGIEVDALNGNMVTKSLSDKLQVSFYCSRVLWTATNRCVFLKDGRNLVERKFCHKMCTTVRAVVENVAAKKKLLLDGNGLYDVAGIRYPIKAECFRRFVF